MRLETIRYFSIIVRYQQFLNDIRTRISRLCGFGQVLVSPSNYERKSIMKIGLQTWGSDGDILPFVALANGLSSVGHEVTVAYTSVDNKDYSHMGKAMNINFIKAFDKFDSETENTFTTITKTKDTFKEFILVLGKYFDPAVEEMYEASKKLCIENDLVIGHIVNHTLLTAAQKYNCPRVSLALCPLAIQMKTWQKG